MEILTAMPRGKASKVCPLGICNTADLSAGKTAQDTVKALSKCSVSEISPSYYLA